jgi:hypothetical protein
MRDFPCKLISVTNGNTIEADFDLCFGVRMKLNIRLFGVADTKEAKADLIALLPREFICETSYNKRGKVGRCLGKIFVLAEDGERININELLIARGHQLET